MSPSGIRRPRSLREVAMESQTYQDFGAHLKDFLHEFEFARQRERPLRPMLAKQPPRLAARFAEGNICDAFLAATADYLSRINGLPTPEWALQDDLVLKEPWFSEEFSTVRMRLLRDTPSAFKDKNLFIFASALSVA
jgi:hypothetical protein